MRKMMFFTAFLVILALGAPLWVRADSAGRDRDAASEDAMKASSAMLPLDDMKITVVYDNNPGIPGLRAEWGFSCLIEGAEKRILFDTGGDAPVILANMESLTIDPGDIDVVVLSHKHEDHTGGIKALVEVNPEVAVYVPESFSGSFKDMLKEAGAEVIDVDAPVEICPGASSIGQMGTLIKEQALAINTDRGLIIITGCAHPGIVSIIERAREVTGRDVVLVMGGFHLGRATDEVLSEVLEGFRNAGVLHAAPCHCSGDRARQIFGEAYGARYIELSVGSVVRGRDLR